MLKKLNWAGVTNLERNSAIEMIKDCISKHNGFITNYNFYSDLALSLVIEINERETQDLSDQLKAIVTMTDPEVQIDAHSQKDILIYMNVSFGKGTGNLKSQIPEIP